MDRLPDSAPTVCGRFVDDVAIDLPDRAGLAVVRTAMRFEETPRTLGAESRRVRALINRALCGWAAVAVRRVGGEPMHQGLLSLGSVYDSGSAAYTAWILAGYRRQLEQPELAGNRDAAPAREVLLAVEKALRIYAQHDPLEIPERDRMLATSWCARALTAAFRAGFITSVPDEASATTAAIVRTH